jgi:uncharacterized repeat protein (TIGR03803 family)
MRQAQLFFVLVSLLTSLSISSSSWAATEKVLHESNGELQGVSPNGVLASDPEGNLYGVTYIGGKSGENGGLCYQSGGCGSVFELSPLASGKWKETVIHNFCLAAGCKDGSTPIGGLVIDTTTGHLYGATRNGGAHSAGVVFEMSLVDGKWEEKVLHAFCSSANCEDGEYPGGNVILDSDGNLYGTTLGGEGIGTTQYGNVFELTPAANGWEEKVLHRFCSLTSCKDGSAPHGRVTFDKEGNLYGTAYGSGAENGGVVYKLTPAAKAPWPYTLIYTFCSVTGCADGENPNGGITFNTAGDIFGVTYYGGAHGVGVVYELTSSDGKWDESVLHSFCSDKSASGACLDGSSPAYEVTFNASGDLDGVTPSGGAENRGVVYELTPSTVEWPEKLLHSFCAKAGCPDGDSPAGTLSVDSAGNLYGTAGGGGYNNGVGGYGVVYEIIP